MSKPISPELRAKLAEANRLYESRGEGPAQSPTGWQRCRESLTTEQVVSMLPPEASGCAQVVGDWVWVWLPRGHACAEQLVDMGFHWSHRRGCWQHPCGVLRTGQAGGDPFTRYRSFFPSKTK